MSISLKLTALALVALSTLSAQAFETGGLDIVGTNCLVPNGSHELIPQEGNENRFGFNTEFYLKKDAATKLARGSCSFSLVVTAKKGHKVLVANAYQTVSLRAADQARAMINLEVFKAGSRNEVISESLNAEGRSAKKNAALQKGDLAAITECSGSIILRGNLSASVIGAGKASVYARPLWLDIVEVPCSND